MADDQPDFEHDPRNTVKSIFDEAKLCWGTSLIMKVGAAGLGVFYIACHVTAALAPFTVAVIAAASELFQWRSDILRGHAEGLKRKIEYHDAFGWPISNMDLSDQLAQMTNKKREAIAKSVRENYFACREAQGPKRAVENLQESAWWSKHLSANMLTLCGIIMVCLFFGSFAVLVISASTIKNYTTLESVSRVVTAVLAFIVSLGLTRMIVGYYNFNKKSENAERGAALLLKNDKVDDTDALKLLHEYQIARASAPPIPDRLWKIRRDTLNELWDKYRNGITG